MNSITADPLTIPEVVSRAAAAGVSVNRSTITQRCNRQGIGVKVLGSWLLTPAEADRMIEEIRLIKRIGLGRPARHSSAA